MEYQDTERIKPCVLVLADKKNILKFKYSGFLPTIQKDFDGCHCHLNPYLSIEVNILLVFCSVLQSLIDYWKMIQYEQFDNVNSVTV